MAESEKRTASISVRVSPNLKQRLEREGKREKAKSTSEFIHTLIEEALAAREAAAKTPSDTPAIEPAIGAKLDQLLHGLETAEATTGTILDRQDKERREVTDELRNIRGAVALALVNVLVQVAGVEHEKARSAVFAAMTPTSTKPPT